MSGTASRTQLPTPDDRTSKGVSAMQEISLPARIPPDAILEALVEFRFEHADLPELVLGRLLDVPLWAEFSQTRLPAADIPQPLRDSDINLRYQPLVELRKADGSRIAKIGGRVMSYHIVAPYPGWDVFRAEIGLALHEVITKLKSPRFSRVGFRYVNALRPDGHNIRDLRDTNISLKVGNDVITESLVVNYIRSLSPNHTVTVKVATPDLVIGPIPAGYSLLCDVDVATKEGNFLTDYAELVAWIDDAHTLEKAEFFAILPEAITKTLAVKSEGNENG
jgi:uncharacterized protein (TIGR04255 family)